jgi:hypothetical protein
VRLKFDYRSLEEQFIRGDMSVRELCRVNGIGPQSYSAVHDQARKQDDKGRTWYDKRTEYQTRATDKTLELLGEREARRRLREAEVRDNVIEAVNDAVNKLRADMHATKRVQHGIDPESGEPIYETEPIYRLKPADVSTLLDKLLLFFGPPAEQGDSVGFTVHRPHDPRLGVEALIRLTSEAGNRSRQPEPRRVGGSPPGGPEEPRAN